MVIGWRTRYTLISFQKLSPLRFIFLPHLPLPLPLPLPLRTSLIHPSANPRLAQTRNIILPYMGDFWVYSSFFFFFIASHRVRHPIFFYNPSTPTLLSKAPGGPRKLLHILHSPSQPDLIKFKTKAKGQKAKYGNLITITLSTAKIQGRVS